MTVLIVCTAWYQAMAAAPGLMPVAELDMAALQLPKQPTQLSDDNFDMLGDWTTGKRLQTTC